MLGITPPWEWPRDAGDTLKTYLRDQAAPEADRIMALELSGDLVVMDDEIARLLLGVLSNPGEREQVRAKAAISLGPVLEQTDVDQFDEDLPPEYREEPKITPETFDKIKSTLRDLYQDEATPKLVRRRILEASVRAGAGWHADAIRTAYASSDEEWKLTAVFGMSYTPGFEKQILDSLKSKNEDIRREALKAAGERGIPQAWPEIEALLESPRTPKNLLLDAIEASVSVNPDEAGALLVRLADSDDEDIAEAASDAMTEAGASSLFDEDEEDEESSGGGYIN